MECTGSVEPRQPHRVPSGYPPPGFPQLQASLSRSMASFGARSCPVFQDPDPRDQTRAHDGNRYRNPSLKARTSTVAMCVNVAVARWNRMGEHDTCRVPLDSSVPARHVHDLHFLQEAPRLERGAGELPGRPPNRETPMRASTENIGIARHREGLDRLEPTAPSGQGSCWYRMLRWWSGNPRRRRPLQAPRTALHRAAGRAGAGAGPTGYRSDIPWRWPTPAPPGHACGRTAPWEAWCAISVRGSPARRRS